MGWVSPDGFVDPDTVWTNEPNAYDENTATYAYHHEDDLGSYLELTLSAPISCDKVQIFLSSMYSTTGDEYDAYVDIDVYYGLAWHNIWDGESVTIAKKEWVEKAIGSTETVSAARVKWNSMGGTINYGLVYEFDFNEVEGVETLTISVNETITITEALD